MKHKPVPVSPPLETPVFEKVPHGLRATPVEPPPGAKAKKRENIFSRSKDIREDRGSREMKTSHNPQTNHGHP